MASSVEVVKGRQQRRLLRQLEQQIVEAAADPDKVRELTARRDMLTERWKSGCNARTAHSVRGELRRSSRSLFFAR